MTEITQRDGERLVPEKFESKVDQIAFFKHLYAYDFLKKFNGECHRVLEIGFGSGYGTSYIAPFFQEVSALEVDQEPVQYAKEKYHRENIKFGNYNGKTLPFPDNTFDLVFSFQVIEHVEADLDFLKEAKRVLKPSGRLVVTTPNRNYRLKPGQKPLNRFHVREYAPEDLIHLSQKVFNQFEVQGLFGIGEIHQIEVNRIKKGWGKYDFLGIRHYIPVSFKKSLKKIVKICMNKKNDTQAIIHEVSVKDFELKSGDITHSLDLYLMARK